MININITNTATTHIASPYLKSLLFNAVILILIASLLPQSNAQSFEAAAICIAWRKRCNFKLSSQSGLCHKYVGIKDQPITCVRKACKYCSWKSNRDRAACRSNAIRKYCPIAFQTNDLSNPPKPSPPQSSTQSPQQMSNSPTPPSQKPGQCTYYGQNGKVLIDFSNIIPFSKWSPTSIKQRNKQFKGLIWDKNGANTIYPRGTAQMCFPVNIPDPGQYYVTAITSAPHPTEHNDMWMRLSTGMNLLRARTGKFRKITNQYVKSYQNTGHNTVSYIISTVNGEPHQFVSSPMKKNEVVTLCVSARSTKFSVYGLALIKCEGLECMRTSKYMSSAVRNLNPSECK